MLPLQWLQALSVQADSRLGANALVEYRTYSGIFSSSERTNKLCCACKMFPQVAPYAHPPTEKWKVSGRSKIHTPPVTHSGDVEKPKSSQQCIAAAKKLFFNHGRDQHRSVTTASIRAALETQPVNITTIWASLNELQTMQSQLYQCIGQHQRSLKAAVIIWTTSIKAHLSCIRIQTSLALSPAVIQSTCWQWELSCTDSAPPEDSTVHGNSFPWQLSQFFWFALHCHSGTEQLVWLLWLTDTYPAA